MDNQNTIIKEKLALGYSMNILSFLAAIAALYVIMSVGLSVGWSVSGSVATSFKVSLNA